MYSKSEVTKIKKKQIGGKEIVKKLISVLTLGMFLMLGLSLRTIKAETDLIDIFPYDQESCLLAQDGCVGTKVGSANWTIEYAGYRHHLVKGADKYASEMTVNSEGFVDSTGFVGKSWGSFGMVFINNTEEDIKLKDGDRSKLTSGSKDFIYAYFDENGKLQKLEDAVLAYVIVNEKHDDEEADPVWRLATEIERETYETAEEKPANMKSANIRIVRDADDETKYGLEPIKNLGWEHADYVSTDPESEKSVLVDYDPNEVHLPAGWTILTLGFNDRANPKSLDFARAMADAFTDVTTAAMVKKYQEVPPVLTYTGLDQNAFIDGIQVIADWDEDFELDISQLSATWMNMFDDEGKIIHKTEKIPYNIIIKQDETVLETIIFTPNAEGNYEASGPFTKVDTSEFETIYEFEMATKAPNNLERSIEGQIVVGVLPNRFEGVKDRFSKDGIYIDLLEDIQAFNGNDGDITSAIKATYPEGFNPYNPLPGEYVITLDVAYKHTFDAIFEGNHKLTLYDITTDPENPELKQTGLIDIETRYNIAYNKDVSGGLPHYIDYDHKELVAQTAGAWGWGTSAMVIGADGIVNRVFDGFGGGYSERYYDAEGNAAATSHGNGTGLLAAVKEHQLQEGEAMVLAHGGSLIKASLGYDSKFEFGRPTTYYTAESQTTYTLIISDATAPQAKAVKDPYKIDNTMFEDVDEAILSNVVGFDNYSEINMFVLDDGGLDLSVPGKYNVRVEVEDIAGNSVEVSYVVEVVKPNLSPAEVEELLAEQLEAQKAEQEAARQAELEATKKELNDKIAKLEAKPDKAGAPIWLVILLVVVGSAASFGAAFLLLRKK